MAEEAKIILFAEGWVRKKVPSGLCICSGMRPWQNRYWILTNKALKYYSEQVTVDDPRTPTGVIPLLNISRVEYLPDKRVGCRFDITVRNRRVYALDATTPEEAKGWVLKIKKAVVHSQTEADDAKRDRHDLPTDVLSGLQELFFRARFGDMALAVRRAPKTDADKELAQVMRTRFATDADVLRYLLVDVMDPKHGLFDYDVTTDLEIEQYEKDQEKKRAADAAAAAACGSPRAATLKVDSTPVPVAAPVPTASASAVTAEALDGNPDDLLAGAVVVTMHAHKRGSAFAVRASMANAPGDAKYGGGGGGGAMAGNPANGAAAAAAAGAGVNGAAKPSEGVQRVVELLRSGTKELLKAIQPVFTTKDTVAHGLAVKVLWTMYRGLCLSHAWTREEAADHFYNVVRFHAQGGNRFNTHVRQAMYTLLCSPTLPTRDVDKPTTVSFFMNVMHHELWRCLFACAAESDMEVRRLALEDVTTLLHENYKNAKSIVRSRDWQSWMYLLLTDVPRNEQTKTHKQVFGFVLNALTLVHHAYFHDDLSFPDVVFDSLQTLHGFAGLNNGSAAVAQTIVSALLNKLFHGRATITADTDYGSIRWQNVLQLNRVVKRYVFQTAYWRSTTAAEDEKDRVSAREEADRQRRELAAAGVPVAAQAGSARTGGVGLEEIGLSDLGALGGQAGGKTTAEERARMVEVMERKRREAEETYVLAKARAKAQYSLVAPDEQLLITEFGLHWNEKGEPSDVLLVELMKKLLKALRVDEYDPATVSPTTTAAEKQFLQRCKAEAEFWRDSAVLMALLKRHQIDDLKLYTYRKLSFVTQEWLRASSTSARESVISDMKFLLANKGASRGSTIVSSTSQAAAAVAAKADAPAAGGAGASGAKPSAAARKRTKNDFE